MGIIRTFFSEHNTEDFVSARKDMEIAAAQIPAGKTDSLANLAEDAGDYLEDVDGIAAVISKIDEDIEDTLIPAGPEIVDMASSISRVNWVKMENGRSETNEEISRNEKIVLLIAVANADGMYLSFASMMFMSFSKFIIDL